MEHYTDLHMARCFTHWQARVVGLAVVWLIAHKFPDQRMMAAQDRPQQWLWIWISSDRPSRCSPSRIAATVCSISRVVAVEIQVLGGRLET